MMVIWKDIPNYEGIYQISNYGEVMRLRSFDSRGHLRCSRIKKQSQNNDGYMVIGLHKDGVETKYLVHRLVAQLFIPNPYDYKEVNHKDENKHNNAVSNLEWCTHIYNANYGTAQKRRMITLREKREEK